VNRKPIYHKDTREYRVVSKPNGMWVAQYRSGQGKREHDPWSDQQQPTTLERAVERMYQLLPMREGRR
jgi:hypothetical protein